MASGPQDTGTPQKAGTSLETTATLRTGGFRKSGATQDGASAQGDASTPNAGWSIFGYLISGMVCYGGLGWLIGRWTHLSALFPIGMLAGLGVGIFAVIYKYGRQ